MTTLTKSSGCHSCITPSYALTHLWNFTTTPVRNSNNLLMFFIILLHFLSFSASPSTVPAVTSPPLNFRIPSQSLSLVPNSFSPRNHCFICISNCFILLPFLFLIDGFFIAPFSILRSISSSLHIRPCTLHSISSSLPIGSCTP